MTHTSTQAHLSCHSLKRLDAGVKIAFTLFVYVHLSLFYRKWIQRFRIWCDDGYPRPLIYVFSKIVFLSPSSTQSVSLEWKRNVEILTLTQTQIDFQIFLLPRLVPACSKFSQIRSLKVIPSWKNIIFEHEVQMCSEDWHYIIKEIIEFSLTLHFSFRGNRFFFLASSDPGKRTLAPWRILPVKAASFLIEENLRVISCLCLWMSRCSSDWKRCSNKRWKRKTQKRNWQIYIWMFVL